MTWFRQYKVDHHRRIDVLENDDPHERQALQIQRDLVNVRFIEDAAAECEALLDDARDILEAGSTFLLDQSS